MNKPQQKLITKAIFIRASVQFQFRGKDYTFLNQFISSYGVAGIRWPYFDPSEHVGAEVTVNLKILSGERFHIKTKGTVTAEQTKDASYLGVRFELTEYDRTLLTKAIREHGCYPTVYIRKYPRIPAAEEIGDMPLRAIVRGVDKQLLAFDIANISPNGILLRTENPRSNALIPGERIECQIDPRGKLYESVDFHGLICRIMDERIPHSSNIARYLGIKIVKIDPEDQEHYLSIIRSVLLHFMKKSEPT